MKKLTHSFPILITVILLMAGGCDAYNYPLDTFLRESAGSSLGWDGDYYNLQEAVQDVLRGTKSATLRVRGGGDPIETGPSPVVIPKGKTLTIIPLGTVTFKRRMGNTECLFGIDQGGELILGEKGMSGTLIIDGGMLWDETHTTVTGGISARDAVLVVDGTLRVYGNVIVENNNNINTSYGGSGIRISPQGTCFLDGGIIRYNKASQSGGGIHNKGSIIINNTVISNNFGGGPSISGGIGGAGVYMEEGTFIANKAAISYNTTTTGRGGGVYMEGGIFTIIDTTISYNKSGDMMYGGGGGIYINQGTFTANNATISYNTTAANNNRGGGVYNRDTFTAENNTAIIYNTASGAGKGGGVYTVTGAFTNLDDTVLIKNNSPDETGDGPDLSSI